MNDYRNIKLGFLENHKQNKPIFTDTLVRFVECIRNGQWSDEIELVREAVREHGRNSTPHQTLKDALPGVVLSVEFSSRSKDLPDDKKFIGYNFILQDDSDLHDEKILGEWKQKFSKDKYRLFTAISPSGDGLKSAIAFKLPEGITINASNLRDYHNRIADYYHQFKKDQYGIGNDPSVCDPFRICYVTYDPEVVENFDDVVPIEIPKEVFEEKVIVEKQKNLTNRERRR